MQESPTTREILKEIRYGLIQELERGTPGNHALARFLNNMPGLLPGGHKRHIAEQVPLTAELLTPSGRATIGKLIVDTDEIIRDLSIPVDRFERARVREDDDLLARTSLPVYIALRRRGYTSLDLEI